MEPKVLDRDGCMSTNACMNMHMVQRYIKTETVDALSVFTTFCCHCHRAFSALFSSACISCWLGWRRLYGSWPKQGWRTWQLLAVSHV